MTFALLIIAAIAAEARQISYRAWPLQVQCGVQSLRQKGFLAYGTLVYQPVPKRSEQDPKLAYFHQNQSSDSLHPFCETIRSAIEQGRFLDIEVGTDREVRSMELSSLFFPD